MSRMFEEFSGGYYLGRLFVEPHTADRAAVNPHLHERANEQVYDADSGDAPIVMKLDETHFPVHAADGVPVDTLAVPRSLLEETRVSDPPSLREVLLAKGDQAAALLRWLGAAGDPK